MVIRFVHTIELEGAEPLDYLGLGDKKGFFTSSDRELYDNYPFMAGIKDAGYIIASISGINLWDNYITDLLDPKVNKADATVEFAQQIFQPSRMGPVKGAKPTTATPSNLVVPKAAKVTSVVTKEHKKLQTTFEKAAETNLLPKYRALDPNLKAGYTGSFKTGTVGNPSKPTYGEPINLKSFDIDFWIESDILYKKYGSNLRADPEFRKVLSEIPGFEGMKANKQGFSIKFKPSSK